MLSAPHAFTLQWLLLAIHSFNGSTSVQTVVHNSTYSTVHILYAHPVQTTHVQCTLYIVQTAYLVQTTHVYCANCFPCTNNTCRLCKLLSVWFFLSTALDLFCCSASLGKPAKELESSRFTIFTLMSKQHHENHHFHQRLFESGTLVKETNQLHFLAPLRSQIFLDFHRHYL